MSVRSASRATLVCRPGLIRAAAIAGMVAGMATPSLRAQSARDTLAPGRAFITAVTQGMVYIGAGRIQGLKEGLLVQVPRLGTKGQLHVAFLSSRSAALTLDSLSVLPAVGDTVAFVPSYDHATKSVTAGGGSSSRSRSRGQHLRGRIGLRYLGTYDQGSKFQTRQPGLELLLDGPLGPGVPVGLSVDIRSRRSITYRPDQPAASTQIMGVYQSAVRLQSPNGPLRAVLGRQYAPTLAGVGLFDGVLIDLQKSKWATGVMAGLAPEPGSMAVSSEIRQFGAYFQGRTVVGKPVRVTVTGGAMGSYDRAELNREFAFFQGTVSSRYGSAVVLQEIDINRGWKLAAGEPRLSLTSAYASANLNPTQWFSLSGGFDSRRNVRLYRDLLTPEDVFDDRLRVGYWGGANLTIARKLRLGGDMRVRTVSGTDSLKTTAYSGYASVDRLTPLGLGFRLRGTWYDTPGRGQGRLMVGSVRLAPTSIGALEFSLGTRQEPAVRTDDRFWSGVDAEVFLRRSWFGLVNFTKEWGRDHLTPTTELLYAGLSYRF